MPRDTARSTNELDGGGDYTLSVSLDSSATIGEVLEAIAGVGDGGVDVRTLRPDDARTVAVNVDDLTPIQRETLVYAVHVGYYRMPREASLSTIADRFDVSKSAVSQRLRKAEASLADQVVAGLPDEARRERSVSRP